MSLSEFSLIDSFFARLGATREDVVLGVGDDAALVTIPAGQQLVVAVDTMISGVHFLAEESPRDIAYKLLAVNLSDMAAMGATPAWMTLALTVPEAEEGWLQGFAQGLTELAARYQVQLIGGDTTQGPLTLSLQIQGLVPAGQALLRRGASPGDLVYVSGTLGDAGVGLRIRQQGRPPASPDEAYLVSRLLRPTPRLELGQALRGIASCAIDISDGLVADLAHVCKASGVSACIKLEALPLSPAYRSACGETLDYEPALTAGDDYELCFTVPSHARDKVEALGEALGCPLTCIGQIAVGQGISCQLNGRPYPIHKSGYDHFQGRNAADELM